MIKSKLILPALMLMLVLMAGSVMAGTCTFTSPAASGRVSGTSFVFNITSTNETVAWCNITATSALSSGSWAVGNTLNDTVSAADANISNVTVDTSGNEDAADWIFTASCKNSTNVVIDTCTRTANIDNGVPSVASCTIGGSSASNGSVGSSNSVFACTVKNATTCSAYWKTTTALAFSSSVATRSDMTLDAFTASSSYGASGTTATANLKQIEDNRKNVYITCSDGTNSTSSTVYAVSTDGWSNTQQPGPSSNQQYTVTKSKDNNLIIFAAAGIAMVLLALAAIYYSKKRR